MTEIINSLNNRETATVIWFITIFLLAIIISPVRHAFFQMAKIFFNKTIFVPFMIMLIYIFFMVKFFEQVGFWDISAAKDTAIWVIGTAFATFFGINKALEDKEYFKNIILNNIKLVLILEFIFNLYSFNLVVEIIIIPIVSSVALLAWFAGTKPEYKQVKSVLNYLLGIIGLWLFAFTFRELVNNIENFFTLKHLRDFLLPPVFTFCFLPLAYFMALYMQYELLFIRVDFANKNPDIARYTKRKFFTSCKFNLSKLIKFSRNVGYPRANSKDDVTALMEKAKGQSLKDEK